MPLTGEPTGRGPYADSAMGAWEGGREADDVPSGWMDNVVKRLLEEVNRQLIRAEGAKEGEANDPQTRDMNSRTLARLELTLERLIKLETQRAKSRASIKADAAYGGALEELKHRIDLLVAARGTGKTSGETR